MENEVKSNSGDTKTAESIDQINSCVKLFESLWLNEAKDENFAFSPFSIYAALGVLASGARGETLKQILGFLSHENLGDLNRVNTRLIDELVNGEGPKLIDEHIQTETPIKKKKKRIIINQEPNETEADGEGPKLCFASGIWVTDRYALNPVFKETVSASYKAEAESVDFNESEVVRSKVNRWVESKTNGLIKDILPVGTINSSAMVVSANALYFKGSWKPDQFNPDLTEERPFYLLDGSKIQVPFMFTEEYSLYVSCYKDFKVLKLPYQTLEVAAENKKEKRRKFDPSGTRRFSMYVVLPNARDGLGEVIKKVSSDAAGFLGNYLPTEKVKVHNVRLPKFKILFDFRLTRVLKGLGLELPFDAGKAELTEMLLAGSEKSICISEVVHKCFVEVDEEGTEAAASTAWCEDDYIDMSCPPSPRGIDFVADHPFMFMIREEKSGVVLFMGHVLNPLSDS